ncbi:MAG TPA: hypothetical protein VE133_11945 [Candidatus Sulfotelmatobacter sp.]|nr:hypothetical protein [Candidatus Sulfotelmatobacter sp.]
MTSLTYLRSEEQASAGLSINSDPLLGSWLNTNTATRGIASAILERKGEQIVLRIVAAGSSETCDWGETPANLFADSTSSSEAMAFSAFYDFGFMETQLQAHVRQGVLIIAKFDRFKDNSGRSNYFSKEFFYRAEP